jgi:membrane-bound serine protease (ClpP class)
MKMILCSMRWLGLILLCVGYCGMAGASAATVVELSVSGAISPGTADYIVRGLEVAEERHAELVVLKLDTPGGLDTSMRQIVKQIIASPVPVAAFVAPNGARAASAGTYILYACHIATMAPATNLGAATPVAIGFGGEPAPGKPGAAAKGADGQPASQAPEPLNTLERKQINDAAAYIRALAQLHGRNAEWAEQAVRAAVSLTADEALQRHVIDLVARDVPDLLRQIDGRKVAVLGTERVLHTAGGAVTVWAPDWRSRLLTVITDPSMAYILLLVGIYGLFFEFSHPGFVLPGVAGIISLLLALFAFQLLPINYAGLGLIILGIAFMIGEVFVSSFGVLGIGGVIAFVFGSVMLIDTGVPGYGIPWAVIVPVVVISALLMFVVLRMAIQARQRPVVSGRDELIGRCGEVLEGHEREGWASVRGENWRVRSAVPLARGQKVRVVGIEGLLLEVVPATDDGMQPDAESQCAHR